MVAVAWFWLNDSAMAVAMTLLVLRATARTTGYSVVLTAVCVHVAALLMPTCCTRNVFTLCSNALSLNCDREPLAVVTLNGSVTSK